MKILKNYKIIIMATILNLLYLLYYLTLVYNPKPDIFGSLSEFLNSLIYFPFIVFLTSFIFKEFKQKFIFNLLSLISIYLILIYELIITSFDSFGLSIFLVYLFIPIASSTLSYWLLKLYIKFKGD